MIPAVISTDLWQLVSARGVGGAAARKQEAYTGTSILKMGSDIMTAGISQKPHTTPPGCTSSNPSRIEFLFQPLPALGIIRLQGR